MIKKWMICLLVSILALTVSLGSTAKAQLDEQPDSKQVETQKTWDELMHYALIGHWELAKANGDKLLASDPDPIFILDLAEDNKNYNYYKILSRLEKDSPIKEIATGVIKLVERGRFDRRTQGDWINKEIKRLSSTTRARKLAISRLKDSGEWAVPHMIEVLRDEDRVQEHSIISWALPQLGKAAINPLVVALQQCKEEGARLIILEVLAKIGYPSALATIQEIVEQEDSSPELKTWSLKCISDIIKRDSLGNITAAELYEKLAVDYYNGEDSLAVPTNQDYASVWFWDDQKGLHLKDRDVRRGAFDELMAMRYCENAVRLDKNRVGAISLWLSAYFRLEAEGFEQPLYFGDNHAKAGTYALTAGPEYLHQVLVRAMKNRNRPVALSAISALRRNSGQQSLLFKLKGNRPLVDALDFPDREVRFSAALAIGGVNPKEKFNAEPQVVEILSEAVLQKGQRNAIVVDGDLNRRKQLVSEILGLGNYELVVNNTNFSKAIEEAKQLASIDVIVMSYGADQPSVEQALLMMRKDYRLAFCPTIIVCDPSKRVDANKLKKVYPFVEVVLVGASGDDIQKAAAKVLANNNSRVFASDLADEYAGMAVDVIRKLASSGNDILPVNNAQAALVKATRDSRELIQAAAIESLAFMETMDAQRAITVVALDSTVDLSMRLLSFRNLADSIKSFGNMILSEQVNAIYAIVSSPGEDAKLRDVAAEAYGALNLPSAKISELILDQQIKD